jgi:hypothetical protein
MLLLLMRALASGIDGALERMAAMQEQVSRKKSTPPPEAGPEEGDADQP